MAVKILLTIKKEEINDKLKNFLKEVNCDEDLTGKIIMCAKDKETYLGFGTLELRAHKVYLNTVVTKEDDLVLKLGIIKSLLNLADLRKIKTVYGDNKCMESLYKMTRFKEENDEFFLDLEGYFSAGC